ncbi:MAG TPA: nuclear transport factor 2 family protein [Longimicrobium sp.]|nr:nuclear transport factor 2 family protein [Longimicrobium sp.]
MRRVHLLIAIVPALLLAACTVKVERGPSASAGPPSEAERIVQAQVDAFNRRDVDAFMATYAADAIHWAYPSDTTFNGAARIRAHYTELFSDPDASRLHATVRKRMVQGPYVIDEEYIVGLPADDPHVSVIIYEVRGGLIRNVWFVEDL